MKKLNPWQEFLKNNKGKNFTRKQLRDMYYNRLDKKVDDMKKKDKREQISEPDDWSMEKKQWKTVQDYEKLDKIGEGSYGIVYKARDKSDGSLVALKKMTEDGDEGLPSCALREIAILDFFRNAPSIVQCKDWFIGECNSKIYVAMELCDANLSTYIKTIAEKNSSMSPQMVRNMMYRILLGIAFMHEHHTIHRDLKPQNIVVKKRVNENGEVSQTDVDLKIIDFGMGRAKGYGVAPFTHEVCTLWYRPPEILLGCRQYGEAVDMWSVGCIFYECFKIHTLFPGDSEIDMLFRIFMKLGTPCNETWEGVQDLPEYKSIFPQWKGKSMEQLLDLPPDYTDQEKSQICDLMGRLLTCDPSKRITAVEALYHPFFVPARKECRINSSASAAAAATPVQQQNANVECSPRRVTTRSPSLSQLIFKKSRSKSDLDVVCMQKANLVASKYPSTPPSLASFANKFHIKEYGIEDSATAVFRCGDTTKQSDSAASENIEEEEEEEEEGKERRRNFSLLDEMIRRERRVNWKSMQTYMEKQPDINEKMRIILFDWLVDVHLKFKLAPRTLFICFDMIDRYLSQKTVSRQRLQLVGITCLLLASKIEEIYAPEVRDCVYITNKAYTKHEVLKMERHIVLSLHGLMTFCFGSPYEYLRLMWEYLREFGDRGGNSTTYPHFKMLWHCVANFIIVEKTMPHPPSKIAAAIWFLCVKIYPEIMGVVEDGESKIIDTLPDYFHEPFVGIYSETDVEIHSIVREIEDLLIDKFHKDRTEYKAVILKYSSKYLETSARIFKWRDRIVNEREKEEKKRKDEEKAKQLKTIDKRQSYKSWKDALVSSK